MGDAQTIQAQIKELELDIFYEECKDRHINYVRIDAWKEKIRELRADLARLTEQD